MSQGASYAEEIERAHRVMASVGLKNRCGDHGPHDDPTCCAMRNALAKEMLPATDPASIKRAEPGLYEHYKGGRYRVLFRAKLARSAALAQDCEVVLYADLTLDADATGAHVRACLPEDIEDGRDVQILTAKNSTDGPAFEGCVLVVYVALYGDGRVSVREEGEFFGEAMVVPENGIGKLKVLRFEKVGA